MPKWGVLWFLFINIFLYNFDYISLGVCHVIYLKNLCDLLVDPDVLFGQPWCKVWHSRLELPRIELGTLKLYLIAFVRWCSLYPWATAFWTESKWRGKRPQWRSHTLSIPPLILGSKNERSITFLHLLEVVWVGRSHTSKFSTTTLLSGKIECIWIKYQPRDCITCGFTFMRIQACAPA